MAALLAVAQLERARQAGRHIKEQFGRHSLQLVRHLYFAIQNYVGIHPKPPSLSPSRSANEPALGQRLSNLWQVMSAGSINKTSQRTHHHHHNHLFGHMKMIFYFCGSLIVASREGGGEPQLACEAVDKRRSSLSRLQRELCAAFSPI